MNSETIILEHPLENSGILKQGIISIVTVRSPVVRDFVGLQFSPPVIGQDMISFVSRLTGLKESDVLRIGASDWIKITEALNRLVVGQKK